MVDSRDFFPTKRSKMVTLETLTTSPVVKSFLAGSFSGTCSTLLFQPLDLVKTRIQSTTIHIEPCASSNGLISVVGRVVKNENLFALWKGMAPSMVRCVPGVGLYFSSLHYLKTNFCEGPPSPIQAIALGVVARTFTGVTMIPVTVIKTRYESEVYSYKSIMEAMKLIYTKEGIRGLSCGLLPTLLRDAPFSGLYLMFYTQTKTLVPHYVLEGGLSAPTHFCCGVTAGLMASCVTQPFDVIKTKMQLYPDKFENIFRAVVYVHHKYGFKGYFKGLVPRMLRRTLMAAMAWTVYEQLMKTCGIK